MFEPEILEVPVTARVGADAPDKTIEFTDDGVIAPRVSVIAGVVVGLATEPDIPLAVTTETPVTEPVPPPSCPLLSKFPVKGLNV